MTNAQSIPNLPDVVTARVVKANDGALPTERRFGFSVADYEEIVVAVVLKNSATAATVTAYAWSPEASKFLAYSPTVTYTGGEARVRLRVDRAHTLYLAVTGIAGGVATDDRVFLEVGGLPLYDEVG